MTSALESRRAKKWTRNEIFGRILWRLVHPLFALSPRPFWGWRRLMLRSFGAKISDHVRIHPSVRVTIPWNLNIDRYVGIGDRAILYALGPISIGPSSTISQNAHICAGSHNFRDGKMTLTKPAIVIGADVWVCADAFIGPGVSISDKALIGARAVITNDVSANIIMAGNPAKIIGPRYIETLKSS